MKRASTANRRHAKPRAKRRQPIEWGYENGQQVMVRASGRLAREIPVARWRHLRNTIDDMGNVVEAFNSLRHVPDADRRHTLLCMCATVARTLMMEAADDMRAALALSPWLREAIARIDARMGEPLAGDATRVAREGGA